MMVGESLCVDRELSLSVKGTERRGEAMMGIGGVAVALSTVRIGLAQKV